MSDMIDAFIKAHSAIFKPFDTREIGAKAAVAQVDAAPTKDVKYRGKKEFDEGHVYEGEMMNGKAHGKGKKTYVSGAMYEGEFEEDSIHGKGTYHYASKAVYVGEFRYNK
jgi:hypothetical protein